MDEGTQTPHYHHYSVFPGGESKLQQRICGLKEQHVIVDEDNEWNNVEMVVYQLKVSNSECVVSANMFKS